MPSLTIRRNLLKFWNISSLLPWVLWLSVLIIYQNGCWYRSFLYFLPFPRSSARLSWENAYVFPIAILIGGMISSALEAPKEESDIRVKLFSNINLPETHLFFFGVLLILALLGAIINRTSPFSLPIRLFENFYRNGIFIFGGGQVLVPLMFTEFVQMKQYLHASGFLSGFALQQALPGPTFSFTSYIGALSMKNFGYGITGQIWGEASCTGYKPAGIDPGIAHCAFLGRFWKRSRVLSIPGRDQCGECRIYYCSVYIAGQANWPGFYGDHCPDLYAFLILNFTKISPPVIVLAGILLGYFIWFC